MVDFPGLIILPPKFWRFHPFLSLFLLLVFRAGQITSHVNCFFPIHPSFHPANEGGGNYGSEPDPHSHAMRSNREPERKTKGKEIFFLPNRRSKGDRSRLKRKFSAFSAHQSSPSFGDSADCVITLSDLFRRFHFERKARNFSPDLPRDFISNHKVFWRFVYTLKPPPLPTQWAIRTSFVKTTAGR